MTNLYADDLLMIAKKRAIVSAVLSTILLAACVATFWPPYSLESVFPLYYTSIHVCLIGSILPLRSYYVHQQKYIVTEKEIKVFFNKKQKQVIQCSDVKGIVVAKHAMGSMSQSGAQGYSISISQIALSISLLDYGNVEQVMEKIHGRYIQPQTGRNPSYDNIAVKSALDGHVLYSCQYSERVWRDFLRLCSGVMIVPLSLYEENGDMFQKIREECRGIDIYIDRLF